MDVDYDELFAAVDERLTRCESRLSQRWQDILECEAHIENLADQVKSLTITLKALGLKLPLA